MNTYYRTLFIGRLVQGSSLNIGGTDAVDPACDDVLCRDGMKRITLRGTALAGALVATARKITCIPDCISGEFKTKKDDQATQSSPKDCQESLWRFFNSHPPETMLTEEYRQGVGINYETGAGRDGTLFDMETLPRGTQWWICLEVKRTDSDNGHKAEQLAAAALYEWAQGHCWIGANVARGMGWMTLKDLYAYRLEVDKHLDLWPNSNQDPYTLISGGHESVKGYFKDVEAIRLERFQNFEKDYRVSELRAAEEDCWHYLEIEGTVVAGESSNGYGLDAISIGGHTNDLERTRFDQGHYLYPKTCRQEKISEAFKPDGPIMVTQTADGQNVPFIAGASIRGALRHALHRLLKAHKHDVPRPGQSEKIDPRKVADPLVKQYLQISGNLIESAQWLVCDAYLDDEKDWTAALLQQHAEDEFAGGVYDQSKFNRLALLQAAFKWKMVVEFPKEPASEYQGLLDILRNELVPRAQSSHLPIGGAKWRGMGWPQWTIISSRLVPILYDTGDKDDAQ